MKKYHEVFVSTPLKDAVNKSVTNYEVVGVGAAGLEYVCTLKEDVFTNLVLKTNVRNVNIPVVKFFTFRDAMYHIRDTYTNISDGEIE